MIRYYQPNILLGTWGVLSTVNIAKRSASQNLHSKVSCLTPTKHQRLLPGTYFFAPGMFFPRFSHGSLPLFSFHLELLGEAFSDILTFSPHALLYFSSNHLSYLILYVHLKCPIQLTNQAERSKRTWNF